MKAWQLALLLKPALLMAGAVAYYFVVIRGLRWLYPRLPRNRIVDALFRERANRRPDYGPGAQGTTCKVIELLPLDGRRN